MKRSTLILLLIFFNLVSVTLCVHAQDKQVPGSSLKAKINDMSWLAEKMVYDKFLSEIVQVWGDKGSSSLRLQLNKPTQGKTDKLIKTDLNSWTDERFNMYMITDGETQVTKMDDQWIEGAFHFTAKDNRSGKTVTVTEGAFRIPNPKSFKN